MFRRARLSARATVLAFGAVMALGLLFGGAAAFAVPNPPTAHIEAGPSGDNWINASEAGAVMVTGTFAATTPPVNRIIARIVGDENCDAGAPDQTLNQDAVLNHADGTWIAGPFDVSGFAEGSKLCVRARASDNLGQTYGALGTSDNRPIKDTIVLPGTLRLEDPNLDGYMNIAEATTSCCIPATWSAASADATGAQVWFEDFEGNTPADCGPYPDSTTFGAPSSSTGFVNAACAAALPQEKEFTFNGVWRDAAGNISAEAHSDQNPGITDPELPVGLIKDTLAPAAPVVTVASDPIKVANAAEVQVTGTSEPHTKVGITLADGGTTLAKNGVALDENNAFSALFDARSLSDCAYPLTNECITATAVAVDKAGNIGVAATDTVFKDATAPLAPTIDVSPSTITDPNRQHVEIDIDGEHLGTVDLAINDTDPLTPAITDTFQLTSPVAVVKDLSALTEGTITLTATVTDRVGNTGPERVKNVLKQLTATSVTLTSPTPGALEDETVDFTGTAPANAEVSVYEDDNGTAKILGTVTADAGGAWSLTYYYPVKTSGAHTVFARTGTGTAANLGSARVTFNLDAVKPNVTITQPASLAVYDPVVNPGPIRFEGQATDEFTGVKKVELFIYTLDGKAVDHRTAVCPACNSLSAAWSLDAPSTLPPGSYILQAFAVDKVNHRSAQPAEIRFVKL